VAALLKDGKANVTGPVSEKFGKTYDATILPDDTGGKYVNYKMEFNNGAAGATNAKARE
jgi:DNA topoisomerase-3